VLTHAPGKKTLVGSFIAIEAIAQGRELIGKTSKDLVLTNQFPVSGDIKFNYEYFCESSGKLLGSKFVRTSGWNPTINSEKGISLTYDWCLESYRIRKNL
jgi:hypothetical protein